MKVPSLILAVALLGGIALAQDATVIELSQTDAAQAKTLHDAKIAADKAWDDAYRQIVGKYRDVSSGAEFSKDFRFLVPKFSATSGTLTISGSCPTWVPNWATPSTGTNGLYMNPTAIQ